MRVCEQGATHVSPDIFDSIAGLGQDFNSQDLTHDDPSPAVLDGNETNENVQESNSQEQALLLARAPYDRTAHHPPWGRAGGDDSR
eukprot:5293206-Karenia_brevis.AAC.1